MKSFFMMVLFVTACTTTNKDSLLDQQKQYLSEHPEIVVCKPMNSIVEVKYIEATVKYDDGTIGRLHNSFIKSSTEHCTVNYPLELRYTQH